MRRLRPLGYLSALDRRGRAIRVPLAEPPEQGIDMIPSGASRSCDNGPPDLRRQYHASYYGAFVRDLDGHNIEAVWHAPE
jgi:hypothetical protein